MKGQDMGQLSPIELERMHSEALRGVALVEAELAKRRLQGRLITRAEEMEWVPLGSFGEVERLRPGFRVARVLAPELGFNVYGFRAFVGELDPGVSEGTYHKHGEAVKYYLSGTGEEIIEGQRIPVKGGDTAFIPANAWHGTQNTGTEPLRFFAVFQLPGTHLQIPTFMLPHEG